MSNIWLGSNGKVTKYGTKILNVFPRPKLAPRTVRFEFLRANYTPPNTPNGGTWTLVSNTATSSIWDYYRNSDNWEREFSGGANYWQPNVRYIVHEANLRTVTNICRLFYLSAYHWTSPIVTNYSGLVEVRAFFARDATNVRAAFEASEDLETINCYELNSATNCTSMFRCCGRLVNLRLHFTGNVTTTWGMFAYCISLETAPLFDTSSVTAMNEMFDGCSKLKNVPLYNTASVTNFAQMFKDCSSLETTPVFDMTSANSLSNIFEGCSSLNEAPLFDTKNVVYFGGMFKDCTSIEEIPSYDMRSISAAGLNNNLDNLCSGCTSLKKFNSPSNVVWQGGNFSFSGMFRDCVNLETITDTDVFSGFVTMGTNEMFLNCKKLVSPLNVRSGDFYAISMFENCESMTSVPARALSNFRTSKSVRKMFKNCKSLTTFPDVYWPSINIEVEDLRETFAGCINISSGILDAYNKFSTKSYTNGYTDCFKDCGSNTVTGSAELAQIPESWGGTANG